jgi:BirA family biotin operon repressor/biotin-[acetyl-CoA-carboxylase] ligase
MSPFSAAQFRAQLRTDWLGQALIYEPVVGSTMDLARALAREGAAHGTVVLAEEQTLGRGRLGRRWISPYGLNLYFSILLRPALEDLRGLSMIAPLAVVEGTQTACDLACSIKWPNDVQIGEKKLAGVLIESELSGDRPLFAIAGIGVNANFDTSVEPEIAATATSLLRETGAHQDRERVLAACLEAFERCYGEPLDAIRERWRSHLSTLGRDIRVSVQGQIEEGLAEDVTGDGNLILRRHDGSRLSLPAGEVSLRA